MVSLPDAVEMVVNMDKFLIGLLFGSYVCHAMYFHQLESGVVRVFGKSFTCNELVMK